MSRTRRVAIAVTMVSVISSALFAADIQSPTVVIVSPTVSGSITVNATPVIVEGTANGGLALIDVTYEVPNPNPVITQLDPASVMAGSSAFSLTVTGTGFVPSSVVKWNGADRVTTYSSDTQLVATIDSADVATAASVVITVFNPLPGGGTSNQSAFTVAPRLCAVTPISCPESLDSALTVSGCDSIHRAGAYAGLFSFDGVVGSNVVIDMTSNLDTYLYLLRPDGSVAAENDEGPLAGSYIAATLDVSGRWMIEATSYHPNDTGTYSLFFSGCGGSSPQNVVVTYDHDPVLPGVNVTWQESAGAVRYEADVNGFLLDLGPGAGTSTKIYGLTEPVCYAVRVRGVDVAGQRSAWSGRDIAVSTIYTNDPLIAQATTIRATDLADIRSAVDLVRQAAGLSVASYPHAIASGSPILGSDLTETKDALNSALSALGMPLVAFIAPSIDPRIDGSRVQVIRAATK